ncbi:MAG: hypothetical protein GWQ08_02540 [Verrucomicrobiaceae bacterium]|nr:hypothetical protein [Verrucomicrobiaceae bacterium]
MALRPDSTSHFRVTALLLLAPVCSGHELSIEAGSEAVSLSWQPTSITPVGRTPIYPAYELQRSHDLAIWETVLSTQDNPLKAPAERVELVHDLIPNGPTFFRLRFQTTLMGTDLSGADLQDSPLGGIDFSGADLAGAALQNARLTGSNLTSVDLRGANLEGADLSEAILFDVLIDDQTIIDAETRRRIEGADVETSIVINEVRASGDDEIELYNRGGIEVDLSGWQIADERNDPYVIPEGSNLAAGHYLVLVTGTHHAFGLGGADSVTLRSPRKTVDHVVWASGAANTSYCRIPSGSGAFRPCFQATMGAQNLDDLTTTIISPIWIAGGVQGSARGTQFDEPNELTFDQQGNLWAGDVDNLRVQVFDADGNFVTVVGGAGEGLGQFVEPLTGKQGPEAIAVSTDNQVYVVDRGGAKINVYDGEAFSPLREIRSDQFIDPTGLSLSTEGILYVADQGSDQIHRVDTEGQYLGVLQFSQDDGVTPVLAKTETLGLDESRDWLFASSEDASRIEIFQLSTGLWTGNHLVELQSGSVPEPGRVVDDVEGFAIDTLNNLVFVSDEDNGRILIHNLDAKSGLTDPDTNFAFLSAFGRLGSQEGEFLSADGIAVMPETDRLAVADQGNYRIQVFKLSDIIATLP